MDEHLYWQRQQWLERAAAALAKHGFQTVCFSGREEAVPFLLEQARAAQTVGFGGSMTLTELGLVKGVEALGKTALVHGRPGLTPEQRREVMKQQQACDLFFSSSNAITLDGCLVNIDASGNRVCSMAFGPKQVWLVAGANKLVPDVASALRRIKEVVAPPNARRLNFNTPCAVTGRCADCDSPERICRITTIIERRPRATEIGICLINESLGY